MIPVRQGAWYQTVNIAQDCVHVFAFIWRRRRELRNEFAGLNLRQHRILFYVLKVIAYPVNDLVAEATKILCAHVAERGREAFASLFILFHVPTCRILRCGNFSRTISGMRKKRAAPKDYPHPLEKIEAARLMIDVLAAILLPLVLKIFCVLISARIDAD